MIVYTRRWRGLLVSTISFCFWNWDTALSWAFSIVMGLCVDQSLGVALGLLPIHMGDTSLYLDDILFSRAFSGYGSYRKHHVVDKWYSSISDYRLVNQ